MSFTAGVRLGPYEIQAALGAGGMGEVYRARDTRLDRTVALKVVSTPLAGLAEFRERIEREARVVSALEHPHICALYDVGEHDGAPYLVMQYFEGETLADRLKNGPLPPAQAVAIAVQIAGALDAAHRAGVVHRDLKPGNVMLTKSGAKLLDFGLAKSSQAVAATSGASMLPTEHTPMTVQGTILGTWQYMAPEQIEGQQADARTDIFAFGVLLYEMLTGRRAFEGKTQASLFGAILHKEPLQISGVDIPQALARVVRRCLAKDPDQRWQSARDLEWEMRTLQTEGEATQTTSAPARRPGRSRSVTRAAASGALLAVGAALGYLVWRAVSPTPELPLTRLVMPVGPANFLRTPTTAGPILAISNDGRQVAFVGVVANETQLFVRALDQTVATPIAGTQNAVSPAFSPDGRWIAYFSRSTLFKVEVSGGAPQIVANLTGPVFGLSWLDNEWIVFGAQETRGLMRVRAVGAKPERITSIDDKTGLVHGGPMVSLDGRFVLFTSALMNGSETNVMMADVEAGTTRTVVRGAMGGRVTNTGHLLFWRDGNIMAVPIDPESMDVRGAPVTAQGGVETGQGGNWAMSADGTLAFVGGAEVSARSILTWVDQGRIAAAVEAGQDFSDPRLSPNGRFVAVEIVTPGSDIWVIDLMRGTNTRITFEPSEDETPAWSPDGEWIAYSSDRAGQPRTVFRKRADGGGTEEKIWSTPEHSHVEGWTPDGRALLVSRVAAGTLDDVWLVPVGGGGEARPLLQGKFREHGARVSPNARWLAYVSNESGGDQVYVRAFPGLGAKWQVSTSGGGQPVWAADGRRLFYRGEGSVMVVDVENNARAFTPSVPRKVTDDTYLRKGNTHTGWDVGRDGRLLLVRAAGTGGRPTTINIVQNWLADVARRARAD